MTNSEQLQVAHSTSIWLPLTQNWLFTQLSFLPAEIKVHVICERVENTDTFAVPSILCYAEQPAWKVLRRKILRRLRSPAASDLLVEMLRNHKIQLLHSHFGPTAFANRTAARKAQVPHVATFYGYDVNMLPQQDTKWRARYVELFRQIDCILCEGPHMARQIAMLGCPPEKIRVHHLGVDLEDIPFQPRAWDGVGPLRVLMAASFREKKGIPYALQALGSLAQEVDLQITLIGDSDGSSESESEKHRILDVIAEYSLESRVRLLGYQPHDVMLREAYAHHIFLTPSVTAQNGDTEGGAPVTITEMLASGMPVVATTHCDIPEAVGPHNHHLLAEERDAPDLATRLHWLLDNLDAWPPLIAAGRKHVEGEYAASGQGVKLAQHYLALSNR